MKKSITIFGVLVGLIPAFSQISVTANTLQSWTDRTQVIEADTTGSVTINVGSAGANQVWDFSGLTGQSYTAEYNLFQAGKTPYSSDYPAANYAFKVDLQALDMSGTLYQYFNLTTDKMHSLGTVFVLNGDVFSKEKDDEITPLPITFGATWETTSADTFEIPGVGGTITKLMEKHTIDAWGTIKLPSGEYQCLRWKTEGTSEQVTSVGGVEIPMGSSTYIDYTWIGENSLYFASASSMENETNPNFTTASDVSWLKSVSNTTEVATSTEQTVGHFELLGNYPNPFNPATTISFSLNQPTNISLAIFDVRGQLIKTLASGHFEAGTHQATWDGRNMYGQAVAAGAYIYKMTSDADTKIRKMTLLK